MKRNRISDRTFIEAAGGKPCPVLDGKSLLPVFAGKQEHKKYVYGEMKALEHMGKKVNQKTFKCKIVVFCVVVSQATQFLTFHNIKPKNILQSLTIY